MVLPLKISDEQFGDKVGTHMPDFGRNPRSAIDRQWLRDYINYIYMNAVEFRAGIWRGQGETLSSGSNAEGPVMFYRRGADVVVTDMSGNFVTILKDGINNKRFQGAQILPARP
jgi:filamentous hemagglutinin